MARVIYCLSVSVRTGTAPVLVCPTDRKSVCGDRCRELDFSPATRASALAYISSNTKIGKIRRNILRTIHNLGLTGYFGEIFLRNASGGALFATRVLSFFRTDAPAGVPVFAYRHFGRRSRFSAQMLRSAFGCPDNFFRPKMRNNKNNVYICSPEMPVSGIAYSERCRSGRSGRTRNAVYGQLYRGFESLSLRREA